MYSVTTDRYPCWKRRECLAHCHRIRNDQWYFYDWERFSSVEKLDEKLLACLTWSNNKTMRALAGKTMYSYSGRSCWPDR